MKKLLHCTYEGITKCNRVFTFDSRVCNLFCDNSKTNIIDEYKYEEIEVGLCTVIILSIYSYKQ